MSWTRAQVGELLALAEHGALGREQVAQAGQLAPLAPAAHEWLAAADRLFAFAGALLLAAGLIFFFAWNWDDLHRFAKLALAFAGLAACVGVGLAAAPFGTAWRAANLGACLALGALLALIGQTYQTGADVWELFAAWAALMLPFVLLARSSACWALWLVVANAGLLRALSESALFRFVGALDDPTGAALVAGFNLALLVVFELAGGALLVTARRDLHRLAAVGIAVPLALGACIGWWESRYVPLIPTFAAAAGTGAWFYLAVRRDVPMVAIAVFSAIAVASAGLTRILPHEAGFVVVNLIALFVIVASGLAAVWLTRLLREGRRA